VSFILLLLEFMVFLKFKKKSYHFVPIYCFLETKKTIQFSKSYKYLVSIQIYTYTIFIVMFIKIITKVNYKNEKLKIIFVILLKICVMIKF